MLWKGYALMRFAPFPTINSILTNGAELRLQSLLVFGVPMEKRTPVTRRDGASELPLSKEGCDPIQSCTPRTLTDRGPSVAEFRGGYPTELQRRGVSGV
jgi:hypothetical protein